MSKTTCWLKNQDPIQVLVMLSPVFLFFFHLISLEEFSLWFDELCTWRMTLDLQIDSTNQPLFFYLVHFLIKITNSESETTLRLLPAIFGGFIPLTAYLFAKELFNKNVALITWGCLLSSPLVIALSREARVYSLLVLVSILSPFILLKISKEKTDLSR